MYESVPMVMKTSKLTRTCRADRSHGGRRTCGGAREHASARRRPGLRSLFPARRDSGLPAPEVIARRQYLAAHVLCGGRGCRMDLFGQWGTVPCWRGAWGYCGHFFYPRPALWLRSWAASRVVCELASRSSLALDSRPVSGAGWNGDFGAGVHQDGW
jgi:hypothetical protein